MATVRLKVTKDNLDGYLLLGVGFDHSWLLERPVSWIDGVQGTWVRRTLTTKFSHRTYLELSNDHGKSIMTIKDAPYQPLDKFKGSLIKEIGFFRVMGDDIDVLVIAAPPPTKKFQIRESWAGSLAVALLQTEVCGFEILDPATNESQSYLYKGVGISFGPPIKKLPNIPGSGSSSGPWNDFDAPGWMTVKDFSGDATMQTFWNVGMGTNQSRNAFDFAGNVDGDPGFLVHVGNLSTGRTFSLPSAGFSSGSMRLPGEVPEKRGLRKGEL